MKPRTAISWSGGKDSYLALHRSLPAYGVVAMITMFSEDGARSRSHGLRNGCWAVDLELADALRV